MTNFTSIYDKFLSKITDFSLASLDQAIVEEDLMNRVITALAYFPELDDKKKVFVESDMESAPDFVEELSHEEQEIISNLMVINYFDKFIVSEDNMRIQLNSKDYKQYSQAGLLKELKALKAFYRSDTDARKTSYSYRKKFRSKRNDT